MHSIIVTMAMSQSEAMIVKAFSNRNEAVKWMKGQVDIYESSLSSSKSYINKVGNDVVGASVVSDDIKYWWSISDTFIPPECSEMDEWRDTYNGIKPCPYEVVDSFEAGENETVYSVSIATGICVDVKVKKLAENAISLYVMENEDGTMAYRSETREPVVYPVDEDAALAAASGYMSKKEKEEQHVKF